MDTKLAIIICTRNRPVLLNKLFQSISNSNLKPNQIVVVSSGQLITDIISVYSKYLQIKHVHTNKIGQSNQKVIGITLLEIDIDWVFFLDDDLLLFPETITNILKRIDKIENHYIGGIGTRLIPNSNSSDNRDSLKKKLYRRNKGTLRKSGLAIEYQSDFLSKTEWLNGASIWRKETLNKYQLPILNSKYAAYEDVIFSTEVNKSYELIYDPQIRIQEQVSHNETNLNISAFVYVNLWTGYLVCVNAKTKILNYKFLSTFRLIRYLSRLVQTKKITFEVASKAIRIVTSISRLPKDKAASKQIILGMIDEENNSSS